jgi:hypothetical protein
MRYTRLSTVIETVQNTRLHKEWQLFTWHPTGVLDDDLADEMLDVLELEELSDGQQFDRYTDFTQLTTIRLKIGHVFRIADRRRDAPIVRKSAFFADTVVGFGVARLYESLMEDACLDVRAFSKREAAADWLGVPSEVLLPH